MDKSDSEYLEALLIVADVLPSLFSSDVAIGITDLECYIHTIQAKTFQLAVESNSPFPKDGVCDIAIRERKSASSKFSKKVFGFPVNCLAVPVINPSTDHVIGTIVYAISMEMENKVHEMVNELQAFSEELTASAQELSGSTQEIAANNENVNHFAVETHDGIKNLDDIVSYIKGVADSTNLLGLNAAIEAARAGEHGKGFTIVADEIRKLSSDSKQSTEKIKDTLGYMKERINSILEILNKYTTISDTQATQAEQIAAGSERLSEISSDLLKLTENMNR